MNDPLLSICIPTYKRPMYLKEVIFSVANQKRFTETNDVEIIISDDCSGDETEKIVSDYIQLYGEKVRYYKNESNIVDANLEKSLSYGKGVFLKLNNDTLKHIDGSLDAMIEIIYENQIKKNILFFSNGIFKNFNTRLIDNLDSFIQHVSFYATWMPTFGIWREDFAKIKNFSRRATLRFPHMEVMFGLINSGKSIFVDNEKLFESIHPSTKGGYDLLEVFLDNYIFLLTEQVKSGKLAKKTFKKEKRKLLMHFIRPMLVNIALWPKKYYFESKNKYRKIFNYYKEDPLILFVFTICYYISIPYMFFNLPKMKLWITSTVAKNGK